MADFKISLNLVANDNASAVMRQVAANARQFGREAQRAATGAGGGVAGRGKKTPFGVSSVELGQLAANMERVGHVARRSLAVPITLAADFESAILKVNALSGGQLGITGDLDRISKKARELGKATEFTATQAAEGFQILTQAGFSAEDQLNSITTVLDFATFGQVSMAKSADLVGASMGAFGMQGADAATQMGNVMARVAVSTQANVADIGASFKKSGQQAKDLGLDAEDVGTALSVLGKSAIRGGEAGTALKSIFASLASPKGDSAKGALKRLGINKKTMHAALNSGDFKNVLKLFSDGFAKTGITGAERVGMMADIVGKFHANKFSQLVQSLELPEGHANSWDVLSKAVRNTDVELHSAAETMRSGVKGNAVALESAMQELGITIGEKLLPTLLPMIKSAITMAGATATWADRNGTIVKGLARLAVTLAIVGPALSLFLKVAQTVSILSRLTGATQALSGALGGVAPAAGKARGGLARMGGLAGGAFSVGMVGAVTIIAATIYKLNQLRQTSRDTLAEIRTNAEALYIRGEGLTEDLSREDLEKRKGQLEKQIASQRARIDAAKAEEGFGSFVSDAMFGPRDYGETALEGLEAELGQVKGALGRGSVQTAGSREVQRFIRSLDTINRAGLKAFDASDVKDKRDSQLRVLVKVDQQGKYVDTLVDEMSLDAGIVVEGI